MEVDNLYYLLMIAQSSFGFIFLSLKSQVFDIFVTFRQMICTQFNCDIKSLQTDWGGEYRTVPTYLQQHGIIHRISYPHTHEHNGAVERCNQIIVENGLTLLAQSSLPHTFWEHAFNTATYLHNRTITHVLDFISPYQKLYVKIPDYKFLRRLVVSVILFFDPIIHTRLIFALFLVFFLDIAIHTKVICVFIHLHLESTLQDM